MLLAAVASQTKIIQSSCGKEESQRMFKKGSKDERERLGPKNGRREHPQQYRTYNGKSDNHELLLGYDSASWVL